MNTIVQMEMMLLNNLIKIMFNKKILTKRKDKIIFSEIKIRMKPIALQILTKLMKQISNRQRLKLQLWIKSSIMVLQKTKISNRIKVLLND